jgi:hypothetical protein
MFPLLDSSREDKRFWTEWLQPLPKFSLLIPFWIPFWFIVIPRARIALSVLQLANGWASDGSDLESQKGPSRSEECQSKQNVGLPTPPYVFMS